MRNDCEIVQDLLPAYLDETCSPSSRAYVEEHCRDCPACRALLAEAAGDRGEETAPPPPPDVEQVLRKTSWRMHRRAALSCAGVAAVGLYWLVYLWAKSLADQGNYRYFSWSFWELFSAGSLLVPLLTAAWLLTAAVQAVRRGMWRKQAPLLLVLAVLAGAQLGYLHSRSRIVYMNSWTAVERVPDEYHIVIQSGTGDPVVLETTPTVTHLVRTDGTIYGFSYECREDAPEEGVLTGVWIAEE